MHAKISTNLRGLIGLPRGIWAVSFAMMLIAISTTMTFSLSPFFMTEVLGMSIGALGLIEGFTEALSYISKLVSGFSGDFFRRKKPPLVIGVVLATISKPLFILASSFANSFAFVAASKIIERISNGVMAVPRDAYCAEECPPSQRGQSLGLMMSLKTLGCAMGSIFVAIMARYIDDYQTMLWYGFLPCSLSLVVLVVFMQEKRHKRRASTLEGAPATEGATPENHKFTLRFEDFRSLNKVYWSIVGIATLFMCARFSDGFLVLRMQEIGAPKPLSLAIIGIFNLVSALCCLPVGTLSDKIGRRKLLYFSFSTLVIANVCFLIPNAGLGVAMVGVILWGAQRGTVQMLFSALVADSVPEKIVGTALGIYYVISGVTAIIAGYFAGKLAEVYSLDYAFMYGAVVSSIALIILFLFNLKADREKKNSLSIDASVKHKTRLA